MTSPIHRPRLPAWLFATLLLGWFLAPIGGRAFSVPDEARYAIGREMLRSGEFIVPLLNGVPFLDKPPLHYWLNALSFAAFGVHPWSLRLPVALAGFAGCLVVWTLGARWFGARAGRLAALVLASSPLYVLASQYANLDLEVAVLISAATGCLAIGVGPPRSRRWLWAGWALAGAATLAKGFMGLVVPVGAVGAWLVLSGHARDLVGLAPLSGPLVYAAVTLPWFVAVQRAAPAFVDHFVLGQHFERFLAIGRAVDYHRQTGPWMLPLALAAGLLPWTGFLHGGAARPRPRPHDAALPPDSAMSHDDALRADPAETASARQARSHVRLLWLWSAVALTLLSIPRTKFVGYALPALVPLALLVGRQWDAWLRAGDLPRLAALVTAAGLAALALLPLALPTGVQARLAAGAAGALPLELAAVGASAAAAIVLTIVRRNVRGCLAALAAGGAAVSLLVLLHAAAIIERDGTRPLAQQLQRQLRAGDTVASFRHYYYDLPHYLDLLRPMLVADTWNRPDWALVQDNWRRHLYLGLRQRPAASAWLIDEAALPARCPPQGRCFVVTSKQYGVDLQRLLGASYAPIGAWGDAMLFGPRSDRSDRSDHLGSPDLDPGPPRATGAGADPARSGAAARRTRPTDRPVDGP